MAWNPDDRELVAVWLAFNDLRKDGLATFSLAPGRTRGVPSNARDFFDEYNERGMDVMSPGVRCLVPPSKILDRLREERGAAADGVLSEDRIRAGLEELRRVDEMLREAKTDDPGLSDVSARAARSIALAPRVLRGAWHAAVGFAPAVAILFGLLFWLERTDVRLPFLIVGVLLFLYAASDLIGAIRNPSRYFYEFERVKAVRRNATAVGFAALSVGLLFTAFVLLCNVAWRMTDGDFMVASSSAPVDWIVYGLDNLVRTLVLDSAEIYRLDLSEIEHAGGWLPSTFVFLFRVIVGLTAISLIFEAFRRYPRRVDE